MALDREEDVGSPAAARTSAAFVAGVGGASGSDVTAGARPPRFARGQSARLQAHSSFYADAAAEGLVLEEPKSGKERGGKRSASHGPKSSIGRSLGRGRGGGREGDQPVPSDSGGSRDRSRSSSVGAVEDRMVSSRYAVVPDARAVDATAAALSYSAPATAEGNVSAAGGDVMSSGARHALAELRRAASSGGLLDSKGEASHAHGTGGAPHSSSSHRRDTLQPLAVTMAPGSTMDVDPRVSEYAMRKYATYGVATAPQEDATDVVAPAPAPASAPVIFTSDRERPVHRK